MNDEAYVERLESINGFDLNIKSRDNFGALCNHCGWSILTRPELDFPDRTENTIADSDPVVCLCGKDIECEFCGNQLYWVIEEDSSSSVFSKSARDGWPIGVDWTEFGDGEMAYTMCRNLHPQGPFPRPPQTANIWWHSIRRESQGPVVYDAKYFNRLMSCFEVFHQAGLSIGAVQVGVYLSWHLSQEDYLQSARLVLEMVDSNMRGHLSDEEKAFHSLDVDSLKLYIDTKISLKNEGALNTGEIHAGIRNILDGIKQLSEEEQNRSGASVFTFKLMELLDE